MKTFVRETTMSRGILHCCTPINAYMNCTYHDQPLSTGQANHCRSNRNFHVTSIDCMTVKELRINA
jgi:hypothetical protein